MENRHIIGAVPGAVLAAYAYFIVVKDDAIIHLLISISRAALETGWIDAVVAAHRKKKLQGIGKLSLLRLADSSPLNFSRVVILLIAGHLAAVTSYTFGGIKMEAILLPCVKRW